MKPLENVFLNYFFNKSSVYWYSKQYSFSCKRPVFKVSLSRKHNIFSRLPLKSAQKTSERRFVIVLFKKHKNFLRRLFDIHNVQKPLERNLVFLLSVNTSSSYMFLRRLLDIHNVQ